jgi:long-chain acyl-CoA synthetase
MKLKNIPLNDVRKISNLRDMLNESEELFSSKAAFLEKDKKNDIYMGITYSEFKNDVEALGTAFVNMGLKGKKIAVIGENRYKWAVTYLAVVNGVGVIVPVDRMLPEVEIKSLFERSEVSAVVFSDFNREQIISISKNLDFIEYFIGMDYLEDKEGMLSMPLLINKGEKLLKEGNTDYKDAVINNEEMSMLLFTSATTDKSKAVMLSHKNICENLMSMVSMTYIGPEDVFLSVLPIHHTYECTCGFLCPIYRGSTVAFCEGLRHIAKNLKEVRATIMLGVPLLFEAMYSKIWEQVAKSGLERKLKTVIKINNFLKNFGIDLSKKLFSKIHETFGGRIKLLISGAAAIDANVAKGFRDLGIGFIQGYGLTECSPIVCLNRDVDFKDDAVGLPLPGLEVRIDSPNEEGIGEIVVKGQSIMSGYFNDEESTAKVFKDGWFYTGDLAFKDKDGFFHIAGRKKNVIVTKNGKNIYPEEIETLLNRNTYIKECIVFGKYDTNFADVTVAATIVPDYEKIEEEFGSSPLDEKEIYELINKAVKETNKQLVNYKYIRNFNVRKEEFEKTTTKKIKRYTL